MFSVTLLASSPDQDICKPTGWDQWSTRLSWAPLSSCPGRSSHTGWGGSTERCIHTQLPQRLPFNHFYREMEQADVGAIYSIMDLIYHTTLWKCNGKVRSIQNKQYATLHIFLHVCISQHKHSIIIICILQHKRINHNMYIVKISSTILWRWTRMMAYRCIKGPGKGQ